MANTALGLKAIEARYKKAAMGGPWWKERDIRNVRATVWTEDIPALVAEVKRLQTESNIWDKYSLVQIVTECTELRTEVKQLRRELHDERVRRDEWEKMYDQAVAATEVEQLQAELAAVDEALGEFFVPNTEDHGVYRLQAELAATKAVARTWFKKAMRCKKELNRVRQDAQDQSDEVQELWLSPCEAEGRLRRQLGKVVIDRDILLRECQALEIDLSRAEALAALVTPELALLLKRLAICTAAHADSFASPHSSWVLRRRVEVKDARELAARIRQALEETE